MPTIAPEILLIALTVASLGESPSFAMMLSTSSTTTMASSTTVPIASTMANIDRMLMEMPIHSITMKVPSNEMGTTMVGMAV